MIGLLSALVIAAGATESGAVADVPLTAPPLELVPQFPQKSMLGALGLTLACELPTAFFGPSCGHLYAGEEAHFFVTGGIRAADLLALFVLEKWGYGVPPLFDVLQTHFSRSLGAEPLAYPIDLALVLLWWGTAIYDIVDSVFAVRRMNLRARLRAMSAAPPPQGLALLRF